jgi:hypothetical protein
MPVLIFASVQGFSAQPAGTNWIYAISRPLVAPDQTQYFRAWKYDGTVPFNAQQEVELGLFSDVQYAQQACQVDCDTVLPSTTTPADT